MIGPVHLQPKGLYTGGQRALRGEDASWVETERIGGGNKYSNEPLERIDEKCDRARFVQSGCGVEIARCSEVLSLPTVIHDRGAHLDTHVR